MKLPREWKWMFLLVLMLSILACATDRTVSQSPPAPTPSQPVPVSIAQTLSYTEEGGYTRIRLEGSEPITPPFYHVLPNPLRIVIDLPNSDLRNLKEPIKIDNGTVGEVWVTQYDDKGRIEINLLQMTSYNIAREGRVLNIDIEEVKKQEQPKEEASEPAKEPVKEPVAEAAKEPVKERETEAVPVEVKREIPAAAPPEGAPRSVEEGSKEKRAKGVMDIVLEKKDDSAHFSIVTDGRPEKFDSIKLQSPARLVVDIFGVDSRLAKKRLKLANPYIKEVRIGTYPDKVRVVFDSVKTQLPSFQVACLEDRIIVAFGPGAQAMAAPSPPSSVAATPTAATQEKAPAPAEPPKKKEEPAEPSKVQETAERPKVEEKADVPKPQEKPEPPREQGKPVAARPTDAATGRPQSVTAINFLQLDHKSRVAVSVSGEPQMELSVVSKKTLALDLKNAIIPKSLLRNLDTSAFKSAVQSIQPQNIKRGKSSDARILVKLREEAPYETSKEGKIFLLDIENPKVAEAQQPPPAITKETKREEETKPGAKTEEVKTEEVKKQEVRKEEAKEEEKKTEGKDVAPEPKPMVQEPPKIAEKAETPAPVEKKAEKMEAKREVPTPVEKKPEEVKTAEEGPSREKPYSGAKISLDFKDADVKNILRLIAEVSNLNIIAGDDVSGKVTMRLVDVPWDQALDVILASRNLGMTRSGNVVRVAPIETLKREMQAELEAKRSKERVEDLVTEVIPLNYITANMILQTQVKSLLSERGDVRVHEQTNALIIKDIPKGVERVKDVLKHLDARTQQVVIEARIVEANMTFQRELGISWGFDKKIDQNKAEIKGGLPGNKLVDFPAMPATGTAGVFQFLINSAAGMTALDIAISMHELNGDVRIISSPKIATLHNKEASIEQGLRIPYLKITTEGTVTTDFIEANLKLTVLPHITTDGHVKMGIKVKKDAPNREVVVQGVPSIDKKEAITDVLVKDNGVVVIGGIFTIDKEGTTEGIPLVSKIPLLGWLFKRDTKSDQRKDLLIFISPKIIG